MIKKSFLILGCLSLFALFAANANDKNQNDAFNIQESFAEVFNHHEASLWDSDLFDDSRFMLDIKLTATEKKDAAKLSRSFTAHMQKSELFMYHLLTQLDERELPLELAAIPLVESGFNPRAVSNAGAHGVWQFTRQTGKSYGLKRTSNYDDFYDFIKSTDASLRYLEHLYDEFKDWDLAVVAYNQGEFGIKKLIKNAKTRGITTPKAVDLKLSATAKQYLRYFHVYATILKDPEKYGAKLPQIANKPAFKKVEIADNLKSMKQVANLSGTSIATLKQLNAGFLSDSLKSTHHDHILVPVENAQKLEEAIGKL